MPDVQHGGSIRALGRFLVALVMLVSATPILAQATGYYINPNGTISPAVTILCPVDATHSGSCSFSGSGGGGGGLGGTATTTGPTYTNGQSVTNYSFDLNGNMRTVIANTSFGIAGPIPAGSNVIGGVLQSGTWTFGLGTTDATNLAGTKNDLDAIALTTGSKTDPENCAIDATAATILAVLKCVSDQQARTNTALAALHADNTTADSKRPALNGDGGVPSHVTNPVTAVNQDIRPTSQAITAADIGSTVTAGQNNVNLITGTPTAGSTASQAISTAASATLTVSAATGFTGSIETSGDGGTTWAVRGAAQIGYSDSVTAVTGIGVFQYDVTGQTNIRARGTAGTATVQFAFANTPGLVKTVNAQRLTSSISGGSTYYHLVSAATTNSTLIATGPHTLYSLSVTGLNTLAAYVRLYDTAAAPNCASATGAVHTYLVIGSATAQGGLVVPLPTVGEAYVNGFAFCITGGSADTDNTPAPVGVIVNASFK